ncbi:hypothetical protein OEV98_09885 [Caldibacillus lycopersici]|uniref:YqgU-like 6-bladed beta-propeller domain-containing protein n=1 Tax=Perspicuibacillus lycopersici TaxID=1325689 RepID=A0AAE3LQT9_9BACI|nr:hypothetical protein [Perspicuibacillus lycopersici]MCU9613869.1 hypothetical protein [Perspicuibacillus lycopersici]
MRNTRLWMTLCIFIILLTGCQTGQLEEKQRSITLHGSRPEVANNLQKSPAMENSTTFMPLEVDQQSFRFIIGWLNNEEILLYESIDGKSVVSSYNVKTGEKLERLSLAQSIITAEISPAKEQLLIHTAPSAYEAQINIYQLDTWESIYETTIESAEISYEWNGNDESKLIVTAFYQDWSFATFLLNTDEKEMQQMQFPQPFILWLNDTDFVYLNWDTDSPSTTAPVVRKGDREEELFPNKQFYHLFSWKNVMMTISVSEEDEDSAEFQFLDSELHPLYTFEIPHLRKYSGWQIPYFDWVPTETTFMVIEPNTSGLSDEYAGGFRLVARNIANEQSEVIMESIDNAPLSCSPDGKYCLVGYQLEQIVLVHDKEMKEFLLFK